MLGPQLCTLKLVNIQFCLVPRVERGVNYGEIAVVETYRTVPFRALGFISDFRPLSWQPTIPRLRVLCLLRCVYVHLCVCCLV